jgi:hypothetical protein
MTPNELQAAVAGMTLGQQAAWMKANHAALMEMAQRMTDPGSIENQQARENYENREIDWCRSNPDPNVQPGDLRFRLRRIRGSEEMEAVPVTVVEVEKLPDGRRFYEVLHDGRVYSYSAEAFEQLPSTP